MKMNKSARKTLAQAIDDAKRLAVTEYSGLELIACVTVLNSLQNQITNELAKVHSVADVLEFVDDCNAVENETTI